ncbi:MAG: hypothetical protein KDE53_16955, partial [Caldilineaceae bacterium]|nr:hypothetical protein [Caldilineaceae bacterium]
LPLQQSLGVAHTIDETLRHYRVKQPHYTTAYAPAYLLMPPLTFDAGFGPTVVDEEGRRHRLVQRHGVITVTVPFAGRWSFAGRLRGRQSQQVRFAVNGVPVAPAAIALDRDG